MENKKIAVIGHVDHGKTTMTAALVQILSETGDDTVIIQDGKIVQGELPKMPERQLRHDELLALRPYDIPIEPFRAATYASQKPKKPNSGLTIGSYKYKSKKR